MITQKRKESTLIKSGKKSKLQVEINNKEPIHFPSLIHQTPLQINMLPLTLFVQQTDQTLFCQPQVNHRIFSVDDVI